MKRMLGAIIGLVVTVLVVSIIWTVVSPGGGPMGALLGLGRGAIESWCDAQLRAIAANALRPTLDYSRLELELPATAILHDVTLTDGDDTVIAIDALRVALTELPRTGTPLVIAGVEATHPRVRLIRGSDGGFAGFSNLIRSTTGEVTPDGGSTRPSDVFAIRRIRLSDIVLTIEMPDVDTMRLDGIDIDLKTTPEAGDPGWYAFDVALEPKIPFRVDATGRFSIDTAELELAHSLVEVMLDEAQYATLPGVVQPWLREHQVQGHLELGVTGTVALADPTAGTLDLSAHATTVRYVAGEYLGVLDSLDVQATMEDGAARLTYAVGSLLGGNVTLAGSMNLSGERPLEATVHAEGLRLENILVPQAGVPPRFAGKIGLEAVATMAAGTGVRTLGGDGHVTLREGRLGGVRLFETLRSMAGFKTRDDAVGRDRGDADFTIHPTHLAFTNLDVVAEPNAVRGEGELDYDGTIDFRVNAGPLERLQRIVPVIGDLIGKVSDQLVTYHLTGHLSDPTLTVRPLGVGATAAVREPVDD
ncbi:MAG: hypothetical protein KDA25_05685 [Phycisphaerales bacterium]|nr:hypothetical protein [Phycisphaerales bacterium]